MKEFRNELQTDATNSYCKLKKPLRSFKGAYLIANRLPRTQIV